MTICAVINTSNIVTNIIVAEPTDVPPEGTVLVLVPADLPVQIGYTYTDPDFYDFDGVVVSPVIEVLNGE